MCTLHFILFTVAGLFSSRVVDSANQVLITPSDDCGLLDTRYTFFQDRNHTLSPKEVADLSALITATRSEYLGSMIIARNCYRRLDGTLPNLQYTLCQDLVIPYIPSEVNLSNDCPFMEGVCTSPAISVDTGLVDSNNHFGINTPTKDRIQYRQKMTCAPIPIEDRYKLADSTKEDGTTYYYLGGVLDLNGQYQPNYTFSVSPNSKYRMGPYSPMYVFASLAQIVLS
jgi:hypothetical protein